jgi:hypothetical protein
MLKPIGRDLACMRGSTPTPRATKIADYTRRSFENGTKTMENLLGAKSLDKAFEVQTEYAKATYEGYVSHATKLLSKLPAVLLATRAHGRAGN